MVITEAAKDLSDTVKTLLVICSTNAYWALTSDYFLNVCDSNSSFFKVPPGVYIHIFRGEEEKFLKNN
jgi:hypothetical protein